MTSSDDQPPTPSEPPLDPAIIKIVDALAQAQAREDHEQEIKQENLRETEN